MGYKRQHSVPASYLRAWCDPDCPEGQKPYVWISPADGGPAKKKSPKKILRETDMYTIMDESGNRDLRIEKALSQIEERFAKIRRSKLDKRLPLTAEEDAFVCMFVTAMYGRTKSYREHLRSTWGRALDLMEKMEEAHKKASPEQREQMQKASSSVGVPKKPERTLSKDQVAEFVSNPLQQWLPAIVPAVAPKLTQMPSVVMVAPEGSTFVTSDAPCVWFDKRDYETPKGRFAGGLVSPTLEITMPLSPRQLIVFAHRLPRSGYWMGLRRRDVQTFNSRTIAMAGEYVVRNARNA